MLPVPVPWVKVWRYKWAIPVILAMLFAFFAMGAEIGAEAAVNGNETVKEVWDVNQSELRAAAEPVARETADETVLTVEANQAFAQTFLVPAVTLVRDGVFWGYEHPGIGVYMMEIANLTMLGVLAGYVYVTYRSLKWAFRW